MDYTKTGKIDKYLRRNLTEKRYKHSLGVAKMAVSLAKIYGADPVKARYAGLTHDIAKCYTQEEMNLLLREYGIPMEYRDNQALAHSKVGVAMLREDFGVEDEEILMAISSHTTGRYGMSLLEEIIYVADAIEQNRSYPGAFRLRQLVRFDLDQVCLEVIEFCIDNLRYRNRLIDEDTIGARKYIEEKIRMKEGITHG